MAVTEGLNVATAAHGEREKDAYLRSHLSKFEDLSPTKVVRVPFFTSRAIRSLFKAKSVYTIHSKTRHFPFVKVILNIQMQNSRFIEITSFKG